MPIERPSDRHFPCFLCLNEESQDPALDCPSCGKPLDIGSEFVGRKIDQFQLDESVGRGHYGAVFKARNRIGKPVAFKLVPQSLYQATSKDFEAEITKYLRLGSHPNIAELVDAGSVCQEIFGKELEFYFVAMEWIDGRTLTQFIADRPQSASELIGVIFDIVASLKRFEDQNLWHNDLNSDNIIVKEIDPSERATRKYESRYICKVVDIGSAIFRGVRDRGRLSDLQFLAFHISELKAALLSHNNDATREEQFFVDGLDRVIAKLHDEGETRSIDTAASLSDELEALYSSRVLISSDDVVQLDDPFGYLNANDFPNARYITSLFCESIPWIESISSKTSQDTLITGPRGSGKTMILKSLRLLTRMRPIADGENSAEIGTRIAKDTYVGFYISARIEIGNYCVLKKLPRWAESEELTIYYFTMLFAVEVLETIEYGLAKSIWTIGYNAEVEFCHALSANLGLGSATGFSSLKAQIRRQQGILTAGGLLRPPLDAVLNASFFSRLVTDLKAMSMFFDDKDIVFLLDDFSKPKIPESIQKSLLSLIWNTGGGYSFRVSAHSDSVVNEDVRAVQYTVNRDFREINLGGSYLEAIDQSDAEGEVTDFFEDIFSRRFEYTKNYKGKKLHDLLGVDHSGPIGKRLKEMHDAKNARNFRYYGRDTVMKLCSGDISYLIDMVGKMMRTSKRVPISQNLQHRIIRQYAWSELYNLRSALTESGANLFDVALCFGKFSRYKLINTDKGKSPAEFLKIEVELKGMPSEASIAIADLLQNGVFIDGGFSNDSNGSPTRKLFFRKIFTPAFPTTYNSTNTLPMTGQRFAKFVANPNGFLSEKLAEAGESPTEQGSLLDQLAMPVNDDET